MRPPSRLAVYVATVVTFGLACVAFVVVGTPWASTIDGIPLLPTVFLAAAAIAGEVKPLLISARSKERTLSTSAPFVLALVGVAGVGIAVLVQAVASIADDVNRGRETRKSLFNTAQYALSVCATRGIYTWITGAPFFGNDITAGTRDIGALLAAGVAMIGVNWILVAGVVSLATSDSLVSLLRGDVRDLLITNVVLLSVGGIAAIVVSDGVGALALLAAPVVAAHVFTAAAARHAHETMHDGLTELGNRAYLDISIRRALENATKADGVGPGLVLLDLDRFKDFNDTLGHSVGDRILREVATRLTAAAPEGATVHRIGGDEFAVVVPGNLSAARRVALDVLTSFDWPIPVESLSLLVRASIGVVVAPAHGSDVETLMKNADIALYHAKIDRDTISIYSPDYDVNTVERLQLLADLRDALDQKALHVVYQPQVDLDTGRTVGVEALVRWDHPTRGPIGPDEFVPLAENSGLIYPLTSFVLDTALGRLALWRNAGHDLRMAVNLSARHLSDLALPDLVAGTALIHEVPLSALVLEVTETGILSDPSRTDVVVQSLRSRGVGISIDDYGTGNASLGYLKRLEIDELKIDRSFVSNIGTDRHDLIIVRSTLGLAMSLGLRVVAEGIEDEETTAVLRDFGAVIGQGYHLGRPVAPEEITARLVGERASEKRQPPAAG